MKRLLTTLLIIAIAITLSMFLSSKERPVITTLKAYPTATRYPTGINPEHIARMNALGFGNRSEAKTLVYITARIKWEKEFGLPFIGDDEMTKFLKDNYFVLGQAPQYIGDIPESAGNALSENLNRIKGSLPKTEVDWALYEKDNPNSHGGIIIISSLGTIEDEYAKYRTLPNLTLYIAAGVEKFNTDGMEIENGILQAVAPRDPIVFIKVQDGYVELANW